MCMIISYFTDHTHPDGHDRINRRWLGEIEVELVDGKQQRPIKRSSGV